MPLDESLLRAQLSRCLEGVDLDAIPLKRVYGSRLT